MAFQTVARFSELLDGEGVCVEAGGKKLALFRMGDRCFAIDELCPHRDAPLHEGFCEGLEVQCPWHASRFRILDGSVEQGPSARPLPAYECRVRGDVVEVRTRP